MYCINRYIEIFRSSIAELKRTVSTNMSSGPIGMGGYNNRFTPYDVRDRGGNRGVGGGMGGMMGGGPRNDYDNNRGMGGGNRNLSKLFH